MSRDATGRIGLSEDEKARKTVQMMRLGDVEVSRVMEFSGPVGLTTEGFFPNSSRQVWQDNADWLAPDFVDPNTDLVQTAVQTWVLRSEGRTILIDTGLGEGKERPYVPVWSHYTSDYLDNLAAAGVTPEAVDLVINTHLHLDHVGWNTRLVDRSWVPTFPNATYLVNRTDYDFWNPENDSQPGFGRGNQNAFEDSVAPVAAAGQLQLWEGEQHRIDGNLVLEAAAGHTPGSAVVRLASGRDTAFFVGDVLHSPVQIAHPNIHSCFCEEPSAAAASRRRVLGQAAELGSLILPAHFRGSGAARVTSVDAAFAISSWAPLADPTTVAN